MQFWDSAVVVFTPESADTHLQSVPTARLLTALQERTFSYGELLEGFSLENSSEFTREEAGRYVEEALQRLVELDLVQVLESTPA